ncbi:Pyruvate/Phosphoenolpyruvate kinase [Penicillium occitanis (nom. inval.)]|nr:Pyruvate/Phosphoenolpyruvate kinase [Penicillium occitanis (nom. inval.)]PCH02110.1 hypothetical protein PENOC_044990 [Penicillium occitanis (nom. inval.)]
MVGNIDVRASKLGQPDLGSATLNDMREHAELVANLDTMTPLIADADTGYGGQNMIARTVAQYHRSQFKQTPTSLFWKALPPKTKREIHAVFLHLLRCYMVEHGATPSWTPEKAKELGFKIIIFPFAAVAPAYKAIRKGLQQIKDTGTTGIAADFTPKKLFTAVGFKEATEIDVAAWRNLYDGVQSNATDIRRNSMPLAISNESHK